MDKVLNIITIVSMVFMTLFILLQSRGASLGAGFGGSGELHTTRRGVDKTMHQITILLAVVFVVSILLSVMI
ncbi:preprotein translocase subunit SecG [Candidatus Saccharibacteria bacterium CPR2]|nr:preprotein translocase subunit SecG [Candidatus Saccharibacteria bacterium CPR2]